MDWLQYPLAFLLLLGVIVVIHECIVPLALKNHIGKA